MSSDSASDRESLEQTASGAWAIRRATSPIVSGQGLWLDSQDGTRYLDLTSAYGTTPLGHSHPALVEAIGEQAKTLVACPQNLRSESRALFLETLLRHLPSFFERVFLCNSGAEANEAAIKFARLHTGRQALVALKGGFHGRTSAALAATWSPKKRALFEPLPGPVTFVTRNDNEALEAAVDDTVAAVIVEVIQGESGVHPLHAEFLWRAQSLCHERGALLVVDEVQTGFGRSGAWFAHATLGLEPDLMTMAKGIAGGFPMGALAYRASLDTTLFPGAHGSTFGGGPLACAAGRATLDELEQGQWVERGADAGDALMAQLKRELREVPLVREIRGRGLMIGIDLRKKAGPYINALTSEHHVLVLPGGGTTLRLLPALVIDQEQIDRAVAALRDVLSA